MEKKSPVSYLHEKQQKKKKKSTLKISELAEEYNLLLKKSDEEIDLSDIPELDFDKLGKPIVGRFYRPIKKPISLRMDSDVLEWFKSRPHYQKLINKACRLYMYIYQNKKRKSPKFRKKSF